MTLKRRFGVPETKLGKAIEWYINEKIQEFYHRGMSDEAMFDRAQLKDIKVRERELLANYVAVKLENFLQNWKG